MNIIRGRKGNPSKNPTETFTGSVWMDQVFTSEKLNVLDVFFTPGARTYWHKHEIGQLLIVMHGSGYISNENNDVYAIRSGDKVFIPAGEVHWHGGSSNSYLLHTAVSMGKTEWMHEVSDSDYNSACHNESVREE